MFYSCHLVFCSSYLIRERVSAILSAVMHSDPCFFSVFPPIDMDRLVYEEVKDRSVGRPVRSKRNNR